MRPTIDKNKINSNFESEEASFGLSSVDEVYIMSILRNSLYSDKILAVAREYISNAWDANIQVAGLDSLADISSVKPIDINVPSNSNRVFSVRDYGDGLTRDEVFKVFTQYGRSTKRGTNAQIGQFGIGSKCGFAYSDSFTVISRCGGTKTQYLAILDESGKGKMQVLTSAESDEPSGLEIVVNVRKEDVYTFSNRICHVTEFYRVQPRFFQDNEVLTDFLPNRTEEFSCKYGRILSQSANSYGGGFMPLFVLVGGVPYKIDIDKALERVARERVRNLLYNGTVVLESPGNKITLASSREEIEYRRSTIPIVTKIVNAFIDAFRDHIVSADTPKNNYEKRLVNRKLEKYRLGAKYKFKESRLTFTPGGYTINGRNVRNYSYGIGDNGIYLKDIPGKISSVSYGSLILSVKRGYDEVAELEDIAKTIEEFEFDGIEIKRFSDLIEDDEDLPCVVTTSTAAARSGSKRALQSAYLPDPSYCNRGERNTAMWKAAPDDFEPEDTDLYVVLHRFNNTDTEYQGCLGSYMYALYAARRKSYDFTPAKVLPRIVGYRHTKRTPVDKSELLGTELKDWVIAEASAKLDSPEYERAKTLEPLRSAMARSASDYKHMNYSTKHIEKLMPIIKGTSLEQLVPDMKFLVGIDTNTIEREQAYIRAMREISSDYSQSSQPAGKITRAESYVSDFLFLENTFPSGYYADQMQRFLELLRQLNYEEVVERLRLMHIVRTKKFKQEGEGN